MTTRLRSLTLVAILLAAALPAAAQTLSGTVSGQVTDQQGQVLPGVTVVLTGRTGDVEQTSDGEGNFRFIGLQPGEYSVRATLTGFRGFEQRGIVVAIGSTAQVKVQLAVGGLEETVQVTAQAVVDTTSTSTDTNISQELLFAMPFSRTNAAVNMLNNAPGVNSGSAYGGGAGSSNALLLDGVDTRDPEGGTAWTFFNYNIIDSIEVGGLGQPAEYGGFSGAVVNTITKSGGNAFSALQEFRYTGKDLRGDNISSDVKRQNPTLLAAGVDSSKDYTVQLGGPIVRDKAFFFGSIQRYAIKEDPAGPRTIRTEVSPRFNVKLTFQPTTSDTISGNVQYDQYNQTGRTSFLAGVDSTTDALSVEQDSPEWIWNGSYRKVMGGSSFFEAKFTGYWGYFDLDPKNPVPARLNDDGTWSGGAGYSAKYDRLRNQLNASFNRYVEAGGTHNFKFGVEVERSTIRNRQEYTGGVYYYDIGNQPYLAYGYSYDVKGTNKRTTAYAQDQWTVGRFTANVGVRFDGIGGDGDDGTEYYNSKMVSPRLGLAWDVTGRGNSVLKAFYGHLYDGAVFSIWNRAVTGIGDYVIYDVLPGNRLVEADRISGDSKYVTADDIKHPRTDEFNVSYEQQLFGNWRATATYIRRSATNFVNSTLIGGQWSPSAFTNPLTSQPMTIYTWGNRAAITQRFQIDNLETVTYPGAGSVDAERDYNAGMFVLSRRFANRWQAQASYVYSKTAGTVTSASQAAFASSLFETPNTSLINRDGRVPLDRPHEFKLFAGYQVPVVEVSLNASFRGTSGTTYTPFNRVSATRANWTASQDIQLETQGSRRNDPIRILDLRLEKVFSFDVHRFGIYADVENAFNNGVVTARNARFPSVGISGNTVLFGSATAVTAARQITIGARWSF